MLIKIVAVTAVLASTPLYINATQEASSGLSAPQATVRTQDRASLERQVRELRQRLDASENRAERAERRADASEARMETLVQQLEECMDLLAKSATQQRRRNCTPSRSRSLLTYYQWMDGNGHDARAQKMLDTALAEIGDDANRMNAVAWDLLTDDDCAGKFDVAALAIAERMAGKGRRLSHRHLDTIALAQFINGHVDQAIAFQKRAMQSGGKGNDEYTRRLRVYETARRVVLERSAARLAIAAGGGDD